MLKKILIFIITFHINSIRAKPSLPSTIFKASSGFGLTDVPSSSNKSLVKLEFSLDANEAINKKFIGTFIKSKLENKDYDSFDLRFELKKNNQIEEYKINNYFILPVSNKTKYWNSSLIFTKFSNIGLDLSNSLELLNNFNGKLIWKNNISFQHEFSRLEPRTIKINNKAKISKIFNNCDSNQIDEIYSLINKFSKEMIILPGIPINFTTSFRYQKTNWNAELGYNLLFKNKETIELKNKDRSNLEFFEIKDVLKESTDFKEYDQLIKDNNIEVKLEDLDYLHSNPNQITNKIYLMLGYDIKLFNTIMNLFLDMSYSIVPDKDENINILATVSCVF